jgi:hypothetical protein
VVLHSRAVSILLLSRVMRPKAIPVLQLTRTPTRLLHTHVQDRKYGVARGEPCNTIAYMQHWRSSRGVARYQRTWYSSFHRTIRQMIWSVLRLSIFLRAFYTKCSSSRHFTFCRTERHRTCQSDIFTWYYCAGTK